MFNLTDASGRVTLAVAEPERFRSAQRADFESRPPAEPQPLEQGRLAGYRGAADRHLVACSGCTGVTYRGYACSPSGRRGW